MLAFLCCASWIIKVGPLEVPHFPTSLMLQLVYLLPQMKHVHSTDRWEKLGSWCAGRHKRHRSREGIITSDEWKTHLRYVNLSVRKSFSAYLLRIPHSPASLCPLPHTLVGIPFTVRRFLIMRRGQGISRASYVMDCVRVCEFWSPMCVCANLETVYIKWCCQFRWSSGSLLGMLFSVLNMQLPFLVLPFDSAKIDLTKMAIDSPSTF